MDDPFHLGTAAENGHTDLVELLLEDKDIVADALDKQERTPLILAAAKGHGEVVELLLEGETATGNAYVNVNHTAKDGSTALKAALFNGHTDIAEVLLRARSIDVGLTYADNWQPLGAAASGGLLRVAKALVRRYLETGNKTALNAVNESESRPLFLAADNGQAKVVKLLLAHLDDMEPGAIDAVSQGGQTALMVAAGNGRDDIVGLLLEKGANMDIKAEDGMTALRGAILGGHASVVRQLFQRSKELKEELRVKEEQEKLRLRKEHEEQERLRLNKEQEEKEKTKAEEETGGRGEIEVNEGRGGTGKREVEETRG
ncbi:hypothetical protein DL765_007100 [Monosporascus sp. GIB2]|nr:hypothetical protein DL765_007100 [Monosporascus sp. GIB2]